VKQDQVEQLRQRRDRDERLQCPLQAVTRKHNRQAKSREGEHQIIDNDVCRGCYQAPPSVP
jgi:hypothetical protein